MNNLQPCIAWFPLVAAVLWAAQLGSVARAAEKVSGEVLVVLASEQKGAIAPELASIPALRKPPFSAFQSMRVLSRSGVELRVGHAVSVALPNGRRLELKLTERLDDGRSKVRLSINRPNQKDYLPLLEVIASPGEPFFVAGQKHEGGTLVIGVRVGQKAKASPPAAKKK